MNNSFNENFNSDYLWLKTIPIVSARRFSHHIDAVSPPHSPAMKLPLLLLLLTLCVEVSVQQGFWPGAVIGAGIALESAGVGYIAGRASRRHHHQ